MDLRPGVHVLLRFACMCDLMDFVPGILHEWARISLCCLDIAGILLENGVLG